MRILGNVAAVLLWFGAVGVSGAATSAADRPPPVAEGRGIAALEAASAAKKHLFLFFYEGESDNTRASRKVFDEAMRKMGSSVQSLAIDRKTPSERPIVERFAVNTALVPLVFVVAPNGAVTAGIPGKEVSEQRLQAGLATPAEQECLAQLQKQRMVLVCVQNRRTKGNDAAMRGVEDFKGDLKFASFVRVVKVDPDDRAERSFLAKLNVVPTTPEATTVVLAPPGSVVATFRGATEKNTLVALVKNPPQPCCPGEKGGASSKDCGPKK